MDLPLVVGVDGSHHSLQAVDWAVDAAARHAVPLRLIHASLWQRYEGIAPAADPARPWELIRDEEIAASAAERARRGGPEVKVCAEVLPEDPVAALLRAGRDASGLVTGCRGRGGLAALLLGSVSLAVAARASCPVTVVRGGEPNRRGAFGRIVLGVGETAGPSAATRFAFREAEVSGRTLEAVRAWRAPAGEGRMSCCWRGTRHVPTGHGRSGRWITPCGPPNGTAPRSPSTARRSRERPARRSSTRRPPPICWSSAPAAATVTRWGWSSAASPTRHCTTRPAR